ncbi:MAG: hypothetical protein R3300_12960 [Candidatus Promineifilaceae bacterium]|nr:hypothetical protein [Candidatus Promineifilaceae bacterium]
MDRLYIFLIRNDVWIYILCALGLIWYLSQFMRARQMRRRAMFGLETERAERTLKTASVSIVVLAAIMAAVTYVNIEVAPTLPQELLRPPTPTPNIFATPLSSPSPFGQQPATATLLIAPTVTLASAPVPTIAVGETIAITPTLLPSPTPPPPSTSCPAGAEITAPPSGVSATGPVTVFGTAAGPEFGSYLLELSGPATDNQWRAFTEEITDPVLDGILGTTDFSDIAAGTYAVRLRVTAASGDEIGQCIIQIEAPPSSSE